MDKTLARIEELTAPAARHLTPGAGGPGSGKVRARPGVGFGMVPLSVLDLATVSRGSSPAEALADTTRLATVIEELGYRRMWVAEHHGMPSVASSAPAVLIGHLADATTRLRVGAGGVMLPNHAPLVVAEQFATLEALHPGRIDLGLGRAPGTDPFTARALRRSADLGPTQFPEDVVELIHYLVDSDGPPTRPAPVPGRGYLPETWLLGSSTFSAQLAGMLGLPFSFAYHFGPGQVDQALEQYRSTFRPSILLDRPQAMVAVTVLCAPDHRRGGVAGRPVGPHHPPAADRPARARGHPRGGGGLWVHRPGAGAGRRHHGHPPDRRPGDGAPGTGRAAGTHRRRRAHAVDPGPLLRVPGPVADPHGRGLADGRRRRA